MIACRLKSDSLLLFSFSPSTAETLAWKVSGWLRISIPFSREPATFSMSVCTGKSKGTERRCVCSVDSRFSHTSWPAHSTFTVKGRPGGMSSFRTTSPFTRSL